MKSLALILCLCSPCFAQSDADLVLLLQLKAGVTPTVAVDFDRTAKFNELLRKQITPAADAPPKGPAAVIKQPLQGPRALGPTASKPPAVRTAPAPVAVSKSTPRTWHYEYRQSGKCPNGRCPLVRVKVWDTPRATATARMGYYPERSGWWTGCDSWRHLASGPHRGKFNAAWLQSLSWAELQSLHADDHERKTQWQYVVRP